MLTIELADVILDTEKIKVDYKQDSIQMTAGLYEAFLAKGKNGRDGLLVYLHLLYTYRRQGTNRPWATKSYLEQGLKMGNRRVGVARSLLSKMGITEYLRGRGAHGRLGKVYTKLNLVLNPASTMYADMGPMVETKENDHGSPHDTHGSGRQMLEEETKCLKREGAPSHRRDSSQSRLIALFSELYKKSTGKAAPWRWKIDAPTLSKDIKRVGEDNLARAIRYLFDNPPPRMNSFGYGSIHMFLPDAEKALTDAANRLSLIRVCPSCNQEQEHTGPDCLFCAKPMKEAVRAG